MENYFSKHNSLFFLLFFAVLFPQTSWALRPYSSRMALVAGTTSPGFQDGDFLTSTFNRPLGITINPDGTELFISDTDNNRIRIVHLDQKNNVTTLSGGRQAGNQNGSLTEARFNKPQQILYLPGDRLAVNDTGNKLLRLVDLKAGTVSTLAGSASATLNEGPATQVSMSSIQDMAYFSGLDSILLAFNDKPGIKRLDLKNGTLTQVSSVPTNGLNQLKPGALLVWDKKVYLSDSSSPKVFAMELNEKGAADPVSIATAMSSVIALAQNGGILYALQRNDVDPMDRLLPYHYPVTFVSDWGDAVQNPAGRLPTFKDIFNNDSHMSFVTDPNDKRKFYLLNPSSNIVTSFRDLFGTEFAGGDDRNYNGFNDFAYPEIKPPHTFRIMLVGDSRPTVIHMILSTDPTRRQLTLCKRMETELNMLAAIDDQPLNYEVEFLGHSAGNPLFHWPTYEVPPLAAKNDVDLVILFMTVLAGDNPLSAYFMSPLTKEGIMPSYYYDPEFCMKPAEQRISPGILRKFYDLLKAHHLVQIKDNNFILDNALEKEPDLHDTVVQLYGKPVAVLNQRLSSIKTSSGKPVRLLLCFVPDTNYLMDFSPESKIWEDAASRFNFPFLNLFPEVTATKLSFYPQDEESWAGHFTANGHLYMGSLLVHDLIKKGLIPWEKNPEATPTIDEK